MKSYIGPYLRDGKCNVSFDLPDDAKEGDKLSYEIIVEDPITLKKFTNSFEITVAAAQAKPPRKPPSDPKSGGINIPKVVWVKNTKDSWSNHFDDEMDCIHAVDDGEEIEGKYVPQWTFYLNENNAALESELKKHEGLGGLIEEKI